MLRYGRDYYINNGGQKKENERKEVGREKVLEVSYDGLEAALLRGAVMHVASRARGTTPQFTLNPLFEDNDPPNDDNLLLVPKLKTESGYASSVDSGNSSYLGERLCLPHEPQVIETTFENLKTLRKSNTLKLRSAKKRTNNFGGSLRLARPQRPCTIWW